MLILIRGVEKAAIMVDSEKILRYDILRMARKSIKFHKLET